MAKKRANSKKGTRSKVAGKSGSAVAPAKRKRAGKAAADSPTALVAPVDVEPLNTQVCEQIRQLRRRRGWTLEQVASLSGVSRSMLSQVERGAANPTLAVAFRIAQAFGVSLSDLVGVEPRSQIDVVRHDDQSAIFRNDRVCRIRTLSPRNLEKDVEFYEVTLPPGQTLESAGHFSGTREFLTVQSGTISLTSGDEQIEMKRGDSAQYTADVAHSIANIGKSTAVIFLVDIYANDGV